MAPIPLKPKPENPATPLRLKLKAMGYSIMDLRAGKDNPGKDWPTRPDDEASIRRMTGKTTAIRMHLSPYVVVVDADVALEDVRDTILERYRAEFPEFIAKCAMRHSGAIKIALIGRCKTGLKNLRSAVWGKSEEHRTGHKVEVFTHNDTRYVAIAGPHSEGREYGYDGPELWEIDIEALPWLDDVALARMLEIADEVMAAAGLEKAEDKREGDGEKVFDLTPRTVWRNQHDEEHTLREWEEILPVDGEWVRGWPLPEWRKPGTPISKNTATRVKTKNVPGMGLMLSDMETGINHYWAHLGPHMATLAPMLKKLAEETAGQDTAFRKSDEAIGATVKVGGDAPDEPGTDPDERLGWLLKTHAYCAIDDEVIELYQPSDNCRMRTGAFQRQYLSWHEVVPGKAKASMATDRWWLSNGRINVRGVRMHPGESFPLFCERGETFKNTYQKPMHKGSGEVGTFMRFLERFLPDATEREWLLDWMAHKRRKPEIPGSAVLFVADDDDADDVKEGKFGTGRGLMFKIAHRLYGPQYARAQSFSILDGSSGQSAYNSWLHGNLLVTVDESKTSATAHRRGEKKSVFEILKDICDPSPKGHTFNVKYGRSFYGMSYCSFWLATNHADALSIPPKDRRFTILRNGRSMTDEEGREIAAWMEDEGNIAALAAMLDARELGAFNMFRHLETAGKQLMIEMGRTKVEEVMIALMHDETRGLVFTRQQLENAVEDIVNPWERRGSREQRRGGRQWQGEFASAWSDYCVRLSTENGSPWRVRIGGMQVKLYCFRKRRQAASQLREPQRRTEAGKWGAVDELKDQLVVLKGGLGTQKKDE